MKTEEFIIEKYGGRKCDFPLNDITLLAWRAVHPELPFGATKQEAMLKFKSFKKIDPEGKYRIVKETWETVISDNV